MGNSSSLLPASFAPWKIPVALMVTATLAIPMWHASVTMPATAALSQAPALFDLADTDTLIVYAAPANAHPVLKISSRDDNGNWQESELQLNNDFPDYSAKLVESAIAREADVKRD